MKLLLFLTTAASLMAQIAVDTFPMAARFTPDRKFLLVLNGGKNPPSLSVIDFAAAKELSRTPVPDGWLGLTMTKAGDRVYVGGGSRGSVFEFTLAAGVLKPARAFPVAPDSFIGDVQLAPDGHLLYAADLYKDSVVVINPQSGLILSRIKTGRRPCRILFHPSGKSFYVSSWTDGSIGQYDPNNGQRIALTRLAQHPVDMVWSEGPVEDQPAVTARLFVSAANTNSVYVLGASEAGDLSRLESINLALTPRQPLGMTPSGMGLSADGKKLFVACSDVNAAAVIDISGPHSLVESYVPTGAYPTAAFGLPDGKMGVLNGHGNSVQFSDLTAKRAEITIEDHTDIPAGITAKHVLYIVKALPIAVEGISLATAGIVPDYTARLYPNNAGGRRQKWDFEGEESANFPPAGYLWTAAAQAGITMRNYGFFVDNLKTAEADGTQIGGIRDPILAPVTDPDFRGIDPQYADRDRAKEFIEELADFEKEGTMPQLLLMRLTGTTNSNEALGMMVEALFKSRFGSDTVVIETDAGTHRTEYFANGSTPHATLYNELSALRTVELILGLRPLTIFDAAAQPIKP